MPKVKTLTKLFRAIADQDWTSAMEIARALAGDEEAKGHRTAAQLLRGSLNPNGKARSGSSQARSEAATPSILQAALQPLEPSVPLADVVLRPAAKKSISQVVNEWRHRDRLLDAGLRHRSRLLFHGPPGCGKSLTASAIGAELDMPTYVVRFDAVIGAYLGQTALHLRELFRHAESEACVVVFDEIDALGKQRGNPLDVGELDRIVIALMQELEHCHARGLVLATTNLAANLDAALWRRFDLAVEFPRPTKTQLSRYVTSKAKELGLRLTRSVRDRALRTTSFALAESELLAEARRQILQDT